MLYCTWVMNNALNYKFSNEEMAAIKAARRETKDKRADARLILFPD